MSIINKIGKTRLILKEILEDQDFDCSTITTLSDDELSILYELKGDLDYLGSGAAGCNFTVRHKKIPSYYLNVVYLNLPEKDEIEQKKLSRNFKDKIINLYESEFVDKLSSTILIINDKISDTIQKGLDELNIQLQEEINDIELSQEIKDDIESSGYQLKKTHFRKCWIFDINTLTINLKKHRLVSKHITIRDENEIQEILTNCNCSKYQLPIISKHDMMVKYNLGVPGDIMKIIRTSKMCGNYPFYRFVK